MTDHTDTCPCTECSLRRALERTQKELDIFKTVRCNKCGDDGRDTPTSGRHYMAKRGEKCWAKCGGEYVDEVAYLSALADREHALRLPECLYVRRSEIIQAQCAQEPQEHGGSMPLAVPGR